MNERFTAHLIDADGELLRTVTAHNQAGIDANMQPGDTVVSEDPPEEPAWWNGAAWVLRGEPPGPYHEWHAATHAWVEQGGALEAARAARRLVLLAARDSAEASSTFEVDGAVYDSNKVNVGGATTGALLASLQGVPFSQTWTLADNTTKLLDGPAMLRVGAAQLLLTGSIYETYRGLADQLEAATTVADVLLVTWPL